MNPKHDANTQTALDMADARESTSVDVRAVCVFLHHGNENWVRRRNIVDILSQDRVFDKAKREYLSRTERYNRIQAITNRIYELAEQHQWDRADLNTAVASIDEQLPIGLHNIAFEPVFNLQASPELTSKYGRLIETRGIIGCYLQTELGHGTNVQALETTATYIPDTREFEIHSPTLTSSKWWIGALGKMATHGVVQARLILPGGKDAGPHLFFVQLRSLEDHRVVPNITIGDIGPKAMGGAAPLDNGFARFNRVRIPKENMLSKFAKVTDEGKYIKPPHAKLSYGGMLYIRSSMVTSAGWQTAKAATVSIRYATVRRQGNPDASGLERQIITYPSVYYRLIPILSHAYVLIQLGRSLTKAFDTMAERLSSGDASLLAELHATTSGLKILCTTMSVNDIEVARRSMGGHGYSAYAGLGRVYADYVASVTYEGDNFVLDQQVVRSALKSHQKLQSDARSSSSEAVIASLSPSSAYLHVLLSNSRPTTLPSSWRDPEASVSLLEWRAALLVNEHAGNVAEITNSGGDVESSIDAIVNQRIAKGVTEAFVARRVLEIMRDVVPQQISCNGTQEVLGKLYLLHLLTTVESALTDILSFNLLPPPPLSSSSFPQDPSRSLRLEINTLCKELLPHAIGLTDSFGFTDWELDSALGVYDGKVYQALWERVQTEPLNQKEVPDAYEQSIKPILERGQRLAGVRGDAKL
ncbi:acyl-CoA oxidase [Pluteus cervinus]|uniref:Acyl-CoA oxidase n=1 Tax=Pluteus cervinus TaxID=181527 RepID=A0ACD3B546_9AGAR|nr:acyl-CoA oxidase [Pluteus cervinus]